MPSHDSLYLLRNVLTAPRMMYLLRTAPCTNSPELILYDDLLRLAVSETLNISLSDKAWLQASLPVRWGGIGVRRVVQLAPSAYLASAVCTTDLTRSLLPTYLQSHQKLSLDSALSAWKDLASTFNDTAPPPISVGKQRNWDDLICKSESESLLSGTTDPVERARLLAALAEGSGDWLEALPYCINRSETRWLICPDCSWPQTGHSSSTSPPVLLWHNSDIWWSSWTLLQKKCWPTISSQPDQRHHPPSFHWCWRSDNSRTSWTMQQRWCHCETPRRSHHGPVEERPLSGMGCVLPRHFREFAYSNV